jgi:hypothetical protein
MQKALNPRAIDRIELPVCVSAGLIRLVPFVRRPVRFDWRYRPQFTPQVCTGLPQSPPKEFNLRWIHIIFRRRRLIVGRQFDGHIAYPDG